MPSCTTNQSPRSQESLRDWPSSLARRTLRLARFSAALMRVQLYSFSTSAAREKPSRAPCVCSAQSLDRIYELTISAFDDRHKLPIFNTYFLDSLVGCAYWQARIYVIEDFQPHATAALLGGASAMSATERASEPSAKLKFCRCMSISSA